MVPLRYLSVDEVRALHEVMMERLGSPPSSLRDPGLLESAVARPQMAAHYESADLVRQAALLALGIAQNQPYLDGNKRTALLAAIVFLEVNGMRFTGDDLEAARQLELVAKRLDSLEAAGGRFERWLRDHST